MGSRQTTLEQQARLNKNSTKINLVYM